jgi:hypothetical protein
MMLVCPNTLSQRNPWVQDDLETEMFIALESPACNHYNFVDYIAISSCDYGKRVLNDGKELLNKIK